MNEKGILKGAERKEHSWKDTTLGEHFKDVLDEFRDNVVSREDFDPSENL